MELPELLDDCQIRSTDLTDVLPEGITINEIRSFEGKLPQELQTTYTVHLNTGLSFKDQEKIKNFMIQRTWMIERQRKGKRKEINIRPIVDTFVIESPTNITMKLITRSGLPGAKPLEILEHILGRPREELLTSSVCKTEWKLLGE